MVIGTEEFTLTAPTSGGTDWLGQPGNGTVDTSVRGVLGQPRVEGGRIYRQVALPTGTRCPRESRLTRADGTVMTVIGAPTLSAHPLTPMQSMVVVECVEVAS